MNLETLFADPDVFENVLAEMFSGVPAARLADIQRYLNGQKIYNREDLLVVDTNKLMEKNFFTDAEIAKIEKRN